MIERYEDPEIDKIWSNEEKLGLWLKTEMAVIQARVNLSLIDESVVERISVALSKHKINIKWWLKREQEIRHDLNAFLDERLRFLSPDDQQYFHDGLTSYDTEEAAFASMIRNSLSVFEENLKPLIEILKDLAKRYRYTIMNGRTHGQEADIKSFGARCLSWLVALKTGLENLSNAKKNLQYSKLSGAVGNYRGLKADVEKEALRILEFRPFYGATQIMPRELYAPIAEAVCQIVLTLDKIATDIRLGARSGRPILQEPFGKKQKGSSAMPNKKNTISSEQLEGMARMAKGYLQMIMDNIKTWEERAIEQSSVERVAWPDLFHVAIHSTKTMTKVLQGLAVYPDNMLREIIDSCGCYAASEAKEFLRHNGGEYELSAEDAYRIVQLAAFNAFAPTEAAKELRQNPPTSFADAEKALLLFSRQPICKPVSIQDIIADGNLVASEQLAADEKNVNKWNSILSKIFTDTDIRNKWNQIFDPSYLLRGEDTLYKEILGI